MKDRVAPKVLVIRGAVLSGYVDVAKSVGLDPYAMITRCDVPAACLTDPEVKVPAVAVVRLLEESAQRSGRPDFGLRLAERRSLSNIGALALLVREQPTIRRAIEVLIGYMYLHSEALLLSLEEEGEMAALKLAVDVGRPVPVRQGIELGLGFLHRSLQQLLGKNWKPQGIYFTHARPTRTDAYRRFFATPIEFNQEFNGIVCYARDIDAAVPASDPTMARHVQQYLDTIASRPHTTTAAKVRECIYLMLSSSLCSAAHVAKRLGTDRRTIHRHLAKEGETFYGFSKIRTGDALHREPRSPTFRNRRLAWIFRSKRILSLVSWKIWMQYFRVACRAAHRFDNDAIAEHREIALLIGATTWRRVP
jgi:Arabinose-binding domain of AraC transcription regulator, N-term